MINCKMISNTQLLQVDIEENKKKQKNKKKKYIPGLAAFYFKPQYPWTEKQAKELYQKNISKDFNKIFYTDCIEGMKQLSPKSIDLIIADPPFGLEFNGKESIYNRDKNLVLDGYYEIEQSEYYAFSRAWISKLSRLMKNTSSAFIFSGWTNLTDVLLAIKDSGLEIINHIIWFYQFGVFTKRKFVSSHYHLLWVVKNPDNYFFNKIEHYPLDIWKIPRKYKRGEKKNGTKLPLELVSRCIHFCSKPGDLILDPFMGNGTTAICAKGNYRHYLGFEINKNMENIINHGLSKVEVGSLFTPYSDMHPDVQKLKKKYPKAYKVYLKREIKKNDNKK